MWPGCGGPGSQGSVSAARRVGWSGPDGEEFALDKSASAEAKTPAELPTAVVGGTSRRNVLGAIASKRTIATSRGEATTTDSRPDNQTTVRAQESPRPARCGKKRCPPGATVTEPPRGKPLPLDKLFQERPHRPRGVGLAGAGHFGLGAHVDATDARNATVPSIRQPWRRTRVYALTIRFLLLNPDYAQSEPTMLCREP